MCYLTDDAVIDVLMQFAEGIAAMQTDNPETQVMGLSLAQTAAQEIFRRITDRYMTTEELDQITFQSESRESSDATSRT